MKSDPISNTFKNLTISLTFNFSNKESAKLKNMSEKSEVEHATSLNESRNIEVMIFLINWVSTALFVWKCPKAPLNLLKEKH